MNESKYSKYLKYNINKTLKSIVLSIVITACFLFLMSACTKEPDHKIINFVKMTKAKKPKEIEKLPLFQKVEPYKYTALSMRNPFEAMTTLSKQESKGRRPDTGRPKELLESYPLDSLKMVGTLTRGGKSWVLIKDTKGLIHRVGVGNYIGENYGKIIKIEEKSIEIREMVLESDGNYKDKTVTLKLLR